MIAKFNIYNGIPSNISKFVTDLYFGLNPKRSKFNNYLRKIKNWLKEIFLSKSIPLKREKSFKTHIRYFFEGFDDYLEPTIKISINTFGITDFKFREYRNYYQITITLERPGLLIGKHGTTIDALKKSLSDMYNKQVKIEIKESKLWH